MIDLHSHIVPGIDDGADSFETSLKMLKIAAEDGIKSIFATPHYYRGRFEADRETVKDIIGELNLLIKKENIDIEILQGNEVLLDRGILNLYKEGIISTLNGSRYILIEFPFEGPDEYSLDMIYELRLLGLVPIIAHPERYLNFIGKPEEINRYINEGCLFQINGGSLTGIFGRDIQRFSQMLLEQGIINFLGSDAHTPNKRRPELKKSFDIIEKIHSGYKDIMMNDVEKVVSNEEISFRGEKMKARRSILSIFNRK